MKQQRKFINNTERFFMYENNELSEYERNELETEFILNPDLKLEYKVYQEINEFIKRNHEELKRKFADV